MVWLTLLLSPFSLQGCIITSSSQGPQKWVCLPPILSIPTLWELLRLCTWHCPFSRPAFCQGPTPGPLGSMFSGPFRKPTPILTSSGMVVPVVPPVEDSLERGVGAEPCGWGGCLTVACCTRGATVQRGSLLFRVSGSMGWSRSGTPSGFLATQGGHAELCVWSGPLEGGVR